MKSLVRYAFEANLGVPYLLAFPLVFLTPAPLWFSIPVYLAMAFPLLAIASALRRAESKRGYVRASAMESKLRGLANVPKSIGSQGRPSLIGVFAGGTFDDCHFIVSNADGNIQLLVVSRWWPHRPRASVPFDSIANWRQWAREQEARFLVEGAYADAVYSKYFAANLEKLA